MPVELIENKDKNCVAVKISKIEELALVDNIPLVIESDDLNEKFIEGLNKTQLKGVVLSAKESDNRLENFAYLKLQ